MRQTNLPKTLNVKESRKTVCQIKEQIQQRLTVCSLLKFIKNLLQCIALVWTQLDESSY